MGNLITGMQTYKKKIYITVTNHLDAKERKSSIIVYDDMYKELDNILLEHTDLYGLAVTDDMIYANDYSNCQFQLYTTQGNPYFTPRKRVICRQDMRISPLTLEIYTGLLTEYNPKISIYIQKGKVHE